MTTANLNLTMIDFSSHRNQEDNHQNENVGFFNFLPQQKTKTDQVSLHSTENGNNYYLFADSSTHNRIPCNHVDSGYFEQDSFSDPLSPPLAPNDKFSQFDSIVSEIVDEDRNCSLFSFDGSQDESSLRGQQTNNYAFNYRSPGLHGTKISSAGQSTSEHSQCSFHQSGQSHLMSDCWPDGGGSLRAESNPHNLDTQSSSLQSNLSSLANPVPNANYHGMGGNTSRYSEPLRFSGRPTNMQERHAWSSSRAPPFPKEQNTADQGMNLNMCTPADFSKEANSNVSPFVGNDQYLSDFNGNNSFNRSSKVGSYSSRSTSSVNRGGNMKHTAENVNLIKQNSQVSFDVDLHGISGSYWYHNQTGGSFPSENHIPTNNHSDKSLSEAKHHNINAINYLMQNALNKNNQVEQGTLNSPAQLAGLFPNNIFVGSDGSFRSQSVENVRITDSNQLSPKCPENIVLGNWKSGNNAFALDSREHKHSHNQLAAHGRMMGNKSDRNISEKGDAADIHCTVNVPTKMSLNQSAVFNTENTPSVDNGHSVDVHNQQSSKSTLTGNNQAFLGNAQVSPEELLQCLSKLQTSVANSVIQQHHNPKQSLSRKGSTAMAQDKGQRTREDTRIRPVGIYANPTTGTMKGIPPVLTPNDRLTNQLLPKGPPELYHPSLNHPSHHHQNYVPAPGLVSGHFLTGHPTYPAELVEYYPVDPYASFTPAFLPAETIYDVPAYYGLPPFIHGFKQPRRSGPSIELHLKLEECYEQFRNTERERKKTEAELARQHPGKRISSANNIVVPRLPSNPSRVDRLVVDSFKEHARILTLIDKMERLMGAGLHPNIHSALERWLEGIRKVQARRKEEIVNATNRNRNGGPRHQDDKDVLALAASISELTALARRARTATWCALQISDKDNPTLCKLGIDMRMPSLPLHFQQTFTAKLPMTELTTAAEAKD